MIPARRNGKVESVDSLLAELPKIARGPGAENRWNLGDALVVVGVLLLEDVDEPLSARDIDTLVTRIVVKIVHVGGARHGSHRLGHIGVIHHEARRRTGGDV